MIRINLLGGERQSTARSFKFDISQQLTALCGLLVVAAVGGIGLWYWMLTQASARVDAEIVSTEREAVRLKSLLAEVKAFEDRRSQLQDRVDLIERLRQGQSAPVQLLDHVSRSLPDMLWLRALKQDGATVTIEGTSTTLLSLSDFVHNLGDKPILQKPIDIVESKAETVEVLKGQQSSGQELINFTVRADMTGVPKEEPKAKKGKR